MARLEPAFEPVQAKIAGAIRDLGDSSGDSRVFVEELARVCRDKHGVTVKLGTRVTALRADGDRIDGVVTSARPADRRQLRAGARRRRADRGAHRRA